ncbi:MAG: hypothetical protein AAF533_06035 [Acidobacteriota bacterium]
MKRRRIGIRKEDDRKVLESRTPLTPADVGELLTSHPDLEIVVERSYGRGFAHERVFHDDEYAAAGAVLADSLDDCPVVLGIKEIPEDDLVADTTYVFFSHTFKGQPQNMSMLRKLMDLRCTLIDYEMLVVDVTDEEYRAPKLNDLAPASWHERTVSFGRQAGQAGALDSLWALGARLALRGRPEHPLASLRQAKDYRREGRSFGSLALAKEALTEAGRRLREGDTAQPLVVGIAGRGVTAAGVHEMLDVLDPAAHRPTPDELLASDPGTLAPGLHVVELGRAHTSPEVFAKLAPRLTLFLNCIRWEQPPEERFITRQLAHDLHADGEPTGLLVIGDISCDPGGAVEFSVPTYVDDPVYVYDPAKGLAPELASLRWEDDADARRLFAATCSSGLEGDGVVVMAVTNLPCELPLDSSTLFSAAFKDHVPAIAAWAEGHPPTDEPLARPVQRATLLEKGVLTPDYRYIGERYLDG